MLNAKEQSGPWSHVHRAGPVTVKKHHVNMVHVFFKNTPEVKFQEKIPKRILHCVCL